MQTTFWQCYQTAQPTLVLRAQPEVCILLKRLPQAGDYFRWNELRWRVRDISLLEEDSFGVFRHIEAVTGQIVTFTECPGCQGIISCSDLCQVGLHREVPPVSAPNFLRTRPKKPRPETLSAPLREIVARRGNIETLECSHLVHYRHFKFVDKTAMYRRCLECCFTCVVKTRTVKRPRIF